MSYMQEIDRWLDDLLAEHLPEGNLQSAKRQIREKLLESYRNGQAAGASPAPRESRPPRRFSSERHPR
jgi:hypothetical protein